MSGGIAVCEAEGKGLKRRDSCIAKTAENLKNEHVS